MKKTILAVAAAMILASTSAAFAGQQSSMDFSDRTVQIERIAPATIVVEKEPTPIYRKEVHDDVNRSLTTVLLISGVLAIIGL